MIQEALPELSSKGDVQKPNHNYSPEIEQAEDLKKSSTLIEFPGGRGVPEWRKQLSKRVREVQERKAREAAEELAAAQEAGLVSCTIPSGQLELVPDLENPVVNPIVSKALERLERARRVDYSGTQRSAAAAAPALAPETDPANEVIEAPAETRRKLTMVAAPQPLVEADESPAEEFVAIDSAASEVGAVGALSLGPHDRESIVLEVSAPESIVAEAIIPESMVAGSIVAEAPIVTGVDPAPARRQLDRKPVRVISDNDVALSYLETCLSVPALAADTRHDLPGLTRRFFAGIVDLLIIAIMLSPAAAAFYYSNANWAEPRTIGILSGIAAATIFAYLTICTAMTGRTLAMRIFRMRTIDLRTGLIPSGGQSVTMAITYVFSLALAGLGIAYAVIDPDQRTVHDRLSKTIVIRS